MYGLRIFQLRPILMHFLNDNYTNSKNDLQFFLENVVFMEADVVADVHMEYYEGYELHF